LCRGVRAEPSFRLELARIRPPDVRRHVEILNGQVYDLAFTDRDRGEGLAGGCGDWVGEGYGIVLCSFADLSMSSSFFGAEFPDVPGMQSQEGTYSTRDRRQHPDHLPHYRVHIHQPVKLLVRQSIAILEALGPQSALRFGRESEEAQAEC
jgi:hypothetical protein